MVKLRASIVLCVVWLVISNCALAAPSWPAGRKSQAPAASQPVLEDAWPQLSDQQQADAVQALKKDAEEATAALSRPLRGFETRYFLFYSDLQPREAQSWAGLLDRMYVKLADMFAVPKGENIWRGKALIFVFSRKEDYQRFEREVAHAEPGKSAGMCHGAGDGKVMVAFYRQPDALEFAHILVHESVHGFLHRYRTPVHVPPWANEGLAETIATDLVPQRGRRDEVRTRAREGLQQHGSQMGDFFEAGRLEGWQYPVAEMMCTFMIQAGKKNYVDFINGIKEGLSWQDSLETRYKTTQDRLVAAFGLYLGVRNLKP